MQKKVVKRSKPKKRVARRSRVQESLVAKLDPRRFTGMSPKMMAIVGYIVDEKYNWPNIEEMIITEDDMVLARESCDFGYNAFIGAKSDLDRNWRNLIEVADLTQEEEKIAMLLYKRKIRRI